ncbi:MAG TPA: methyltransferase domain-containing protein [Dehalococcoidales bacterium]|nr:methyltransferase domain-containing protein [Dehalococcoidales bacterium]
MTDKLPLEHYHPGASTRSLLDAGKVLRTIGLKKGDSFLDAGCGTGYMSLAASEIVGANGEVYAVDIDKESIDSLKKEIAKKKIANLMALVADVTSKTPLESQSIDVCLMANVLHGFAANKEVPAVMKEINRVLKAGAILAVVEFKKIADIPGPPLSLKLSSEQTAAAITPYHYRQEKVAEVGRYHYAAVFTKDLS